MHPLLFQLKRAYWRTQLTMRPALDRFGLTPARFDLLYVVWKHRGALQPRLAAELGVCGRTVGVMLASLEGLGMVTRKRDVDDRRRNVVTLTDDGRKAVEGVRAEVLQAGRGRDLVHRMLRTTWGRVERASRWCARVLAAFEERLDGWSIAVPDWPGTGREQGPRAADEREEDPLHALMLAGGTYDEFLALKARLVEAEAAEALRTTSSPVAGASR